MRDLRERTRRALRLAAGADEPSPNLDGLREALPGILARAAAERRSALPETTLDAVVPLGRRLLPALAAAAASLGLAAFLLQPATTADEAEGWETSLVAQTADEAESAEAVTEAVLGAYAP